MLIIWLIGFVAVMGYYTISNHKFKKDIKDSSKEITDEHILEIWNTVKTEMNFPAKVKLLASKNAKGPFSMGANEKMFATVLPYECLSGRYTDKQLAMIFSHELHHLQRNDVDTKIFLIFLRAFCWFNPFIWIGVRKAIEDLELSCDEIVVEGMSREDRKIYATMLLTEAAGVSGFTTCLSAVGSTLRYRMKNVVNERKVFQGTFIVGILLFVCFWGYGTIGFTFERGSCRELTIPEKVDDFEIFVHVSEDDETYHTENVDTEKLLAYLDEIDVERIPGRGDYNYDDERNSLYLFAGDREIAINDKVVEVSGYPGKGGCYMYMVDGTIDWDQVFSYMGIEKTSE